MHKTSQAMFANRKVWLQNKTVYVCKETYNLLDLLNQIEAVGFSPLTFL